MANKIILCDITLRDGNHAVNHQLSLKQIADYIRLMDKTGIDIIEVGHGNGLGASSMLLGECIATDDDMIKIAKRNIKNCKLSVHFIPGYGRIRDIESAIDNGVDIVRVASHCTEANITRRYIEYAKNNLITVYGVLMMSHMADIYTLLQEARKMVNYGADAIIIMDSAGTYLPRDVNARIKHLVDNIDIPVGFHAHNNLNLAIANSLMALEAGAKIIDGAVKGFGAGAGNTQLEVLIAALTRYEWRIDVDILNLLETIDIINRKAVISKSPIISPDNIISGLNGVFSGFASHVKRIAQKYKINRFKIYDELGKRQIIAGQEDIIVEIAELLKNGTNSDGK